MDGAVETRVEPVSKQGTQEHHEGMNGHADESHGHQQGDIAFDDGINQVVAEAGKTEGLLCDTCGG